MHNELKDLLCAWYISRLDEGQGYVSDSIHYTVAILTLFFAVSSRQISII